jgi:hypothetical protein
MLKRGDHAKSAVLLALVETVAIFIIAQTGYLSLYWMLPPPALLADLINWELLGATSLSAPRTRVDIFLFWHPTC